MGTQEAELRDAMKVVLDGFDQGFFVRNIDHDHEPMWLLRAAPYLVALGKAAKLITESALQSASTAVNHHEALVAVCRDLVAWEDHDTPVKPLPAILATMRSLLQSATGAPEDAT